MNGPLRVLHVVPYFPPDRVGGVGEVAALLHRGLIEAGHDSHVLTTGVSVDDPRVHRVARTPTGFALFSLLGLDLLRRSDIAHFHHGDALSLMVLASAFRFGTPILTTFHVSARAIRASFRPYCIDNRRIGGGWRNWRMRHVNGLAHTLLDAGARALSSSVTFISQSVARDLRATPAERAQVIYNAVGGLPGPQGVEVVPTDLLFVGTPSLRKRVHILPFLLERVRRSRRDAKLRIVGFDAVEYPDLWRLFKELGVADAVVCEGSVPSDTVRAFYRAARVLVVPSVYEGLPMVILEASHEGLPCVATRLSGHPEVIQDGDNGYLVTLDDVDAMAERCLQLIDDDALHSKMSERARTIVQARFCSHRQLREFVTLYQRLTTSGTREPTADGPKS